MGVAALYVLGYVMSIFFWFFLRAAEVPSTREKIPTEEKLAADSGRGKPQRQKIFSVITRFFFPFSDTRDKEANG
ncbi:MAG: hypothetical protein PVH82_04700 [Desulfobacteraceae bacterium]